MSTSSRPTSPIRVYRHIIVPDRDIHPSITLETLRQGPTHSIAYRIYDQPSDQVPHSVSEEDEERTDNKPDPVQTFQNWHKQTALPRYMFLTQQYARRHSDRR